MRADAGAREAIKETGVEVRYYSIIYEAIDDVKQMMTGMLQPEIKETILGVAQVRDVFRSSKFGVVAGCLVTEGVVKRNNPIRVLRDNVVIFEGALESLRRFKDDVGEVRAGTECGIGVKNYQDVRAGDQIECFSRVEVARTLQLIRPQSAQATRIEAEIQRVLSALIAREVKDPRVGNVTITAGDVARGHRVSREIFFTPFASTNPAEQVRVGLRAPAGSCAVRSGGAWACGTRRGWSSCSTTRSKGGAPDGAHRSRRGER